MIRLIALVTLTCCGTEPEQLPNTYPPLDQTFVYPNGEPDLGALYFMGECEGGWCAGGSFDVWHEGPLEHCITEGSTLQLRVGTIPDAATSFTLEFTIPAQASFALDPDTTQVDWSLADGASAFLFFNEDTIDTKSSGSVDLDQCGAEIAGKFAVNDLCEYHSCSMGDPWTTNVVGAFRCTPTTPIDCGN